MLIFIACLMRCAKVALLATACFLAVIFVSIARGEDWSAYLHDTMRSGVTTEKLAFPLRLAWEYHPAQPPAPAWGEQLHLLNRVDYDYAPHPIIADGLLVFASNADDSVRALDAATGEERWRVTVGGPVRVAPQVADGKVYFGSDDGHAYCLDARDGKAVWKLRASLSDERYVGNQRMISRWPVRSGVLVRDGVAYFVGGLWNTEGVFIYAVGAKDGKLVWCNDTSGCGGVGMVDFIGMGINGHHQGEFGRSGLCPEGPLVANDRFLVIAGGFGGPHALDRKTGLSTGLGGGAAGAGGTWLTLDGDILHTFAKHGQGGGILNIQGYNLATATATKTFGGPQAIPQLEIGPGLRPGDIHERGNVSAILHKGNRYIRKAYGLALAGETLFIGDDGRVVAENAQPRVSAEIRFGAQGNALLVHARVTDAKVTQGSVPWKGSCVEIFGSKPGASESQINDEGDVVPRMRTPEEEEAEKEKKAVKPAQPKVTIGQVMIVPATDAQPARAFVPKDGKPVETAEVTLVTPATKDGYEVAAIIPFSLLAIDKPDAEMRLEAQVTVTGANGTVRRDTLFGSKLAYLDNSSFGSFRLKALAKPTNLAGLKDAIATAKPGVIRMQSSAQEWTAPVNGEAREIAVANGRLYVGTDRGTIYCFAQAGLSDGTVVVHEPGQSRRNTTNEAVAPADVASKAQAALAKAGIDRGFALVVGDADGKVAEAIASNTKLRVVIAMTDAAAVASVRARLVNETNWYGTRIAVEQVERLDQLPFAQYFANAVIVAGKEKLSGKELSRVLHPRGGVLIAPGLNADAGAALLKDAVGEETALNNDDAGASVVRGKLPGALDWDSPKGAVEERVRWPLRPLWFGGPTSRMVLNDKQGAAGPTLANGRYFIKSETTLSGVDAYNGVVLWTRPIPKQWIDSREIDGVLYTVSEPKGFEKQAYQRTVYASDQTLTLVLGEAYSRGKGDAAVRLDTNTGKQLAFYGPYIAPTIIKPATPVTSAIEVDATHSGNVTIEKSDAGVVFTLHTKDAVASRLDTWELYFDLRKPEDRYGLLGPGVFGVRVNLPVAKGAAPTTERCAGDELLRLDAAGTRDAAGTKATVTLPFKELQRITGAKIDSFGLSITLTSHDGGREEPIVRRHLYGDWAAHGVNNGWACAVLDEKALVNGAAPIPAVVKGERKDFKGAGGGITRAAAGLSEEVVSLTRLHPLTGEPEPKTYRPSTLCGAMFFSDRVMSGRAGVYDFDDDSGMRFLGGVKTRCTTPQVVAMGVILISEETGHCSCNYPIRTSLAFAPAERRLNEDWALFHDRDADSLLRHAFIMLGAPGDRRDDKGNLWLGFPRPPSDKGLGYSLLAGTVTNVNTKGYWPRFTSSAMQLPLDVKTFDGPDAWSPEDDVTTSRGWASSWSANRKRRAFGPRRFNPDRVVVTGTDKPWMYASQIRGIQSATLHLNFIKPIASVEANKSPAIDGKSGDAVWTGDAQVKLPFTNAEFRFRHDAENLYVEARRTSVVNRLGQISPWAAATKDDDATVWDDDSFEFFLADASGTVMHLGVSASGSRFDALAPAADNKGTGPGNPGKKEDRTWNGKWTSAAHADDEGMSVEVSIPWKTLADAGIARESLRVNAMVNQKDVTGEENKYPGNTGRSYTPKGTTPEAMVTLGPMGRERCGNFAPLGLGTAPQTPTRRFTVRLHFAEIDETPVGARVFGVKMQGKDVLRGFDIAKEAGGACKALVKEFKHIEASDDLRVEFDPSSPTPAAENAPIISAIEVIDEGFELAPR